MKTTGFYYANHGIMIGSKLNTERSYRFKNPIEAVYRKVAESRGLVFPEKFAYAYSEIQEGRHKGQHLYEVETTSPVVVGTCDRSMQVCSGLLGREPNEKQIREFAEQYFDLVSLNHGIEILSPEWKIVNCLGVAK